MQTNNTDNEYHNFSSEWLICPECGSRKVQCVTNPWGTFTMAACEECGAQARQYE